MQVFVFCKKNVIFFFLSKIIVTMINNNVTLDVSKKQPKNCLFTQKTFLYGITLGFFFV